MRKLHVHPERVLNAKSGIIEEITEEIQSLAKDMKQFVDQNGNAVAGLAAPQFGESVRLFVINKAFTGEDHERIFINPEIIDLQGTANGIEGCLSLPTGKGYIERASYVQLKYQDLEGNIKIEEFGSADEDADARLHYIAAVIQHEVDHLDGKLILDHMSPLVKKITIKKCKKAYERMQVKFYKAMLKKNIAERQAMNKEIEEEKK